MRLTLESQAVEVALDDPRFPLARIYKGFAENGAPIMAQIACVSAREPNAEPALRADLAALPTEMFLTPHQAEYLFGPRRAA